jgi:hypothetical protein
MLRRVLAVLVLGMALACALGASAVAATCTDEFTGANEEQWSVASNWSTHKVPESSSVACWPSNITVLISSPRTYGAVAGSIQGGGLTVANEGAMFFENPAGESTLSGSFTQTELGYVTGPQKLAISGPWDWVSGQLKEVTATQGPGAGLTIGPGNLQAYLYIDSSIFTESPVTIANTAFATDATSLTTTSTITLPEGFDLETGGGNNGTFTAAGIAPNAGAKYGFGGDTLNLTGGTTTVAAGHTLESGPLTLRGGVLDDEGTIGESTHVVETTLAPTTLTGGTLDGTGTVAGSLTNVSGTVAPGDAPGRLTVAGNFLQEAAGTLGIGIAGLIPGTQFDQLLVGGNATLGGTLSASDEGGFVAAIGNTFKVVSGAAKREGAFSGLGGPSGRYYGVEYNPDGATLDTTSVPPAPVKSEPALPTQSAKSIEEVLLGCGKTQLVLNDVYVSGRHVLLSGSAAKSLDGKKVEILFDEGKKVATAKVGPNGQYTTTAPLPPSKLLESNSTRYTAEIGKLRSLHLKLTRRLQLDPPKASGRTVTLSGRLVLPLTKPVAPVAVEQQLECGRDTIVKTFTPSANGRFHITLTVPATARAGLYRLKSKVAANQHAVKHGFTTYSLPLPVVIG